MDISKHQIWIGTAGFVVLVLALFYWHWSGSNRYALLNGPNGLAYRIDRKSGETVMIRGSTSLVVPTPIDQDELEIAPDSAVNLITGRGGFEYKGNSSFEIKLHNASEWFIRLVVVELFDKKNGETAWSKPYVVPCYLKSGSTDTVNFETVDAHLVGDIGWRIVGAKGLND